MNTILTYALREYGVSRQELKIFHRRVSLEVERLRQRGRLIALPGNKQDALEKIGRNAAHVRSATIAFKEGKVADNK